MVTTGQQNHHAVLRTGLLKYGSYVSVITHVKNASSWQKSDTQTISDQAKLGLIHFKVYPTNQFVKSSRLHISNHEIRLRKVHRDQTEVACPTK